MRELWPPRRTTTTNHLGCTRIRSLTCNVARVACSCQWAPRPAALALVPPALRRQGLKDARSVGLAPLAATLERNKAVRRIYAAGNSALKSARSLRTQMSSGEKPASVIQSRWS